MTDNKLFRIIREAVTNSNEEIFGEIVTKPINALVCPRTADEIDRALNTMINTLHDSSCKVEQSTDIRSGDHVIIRPKQENLATEMIMGHHAIVQDVDHERQTVNIIHYYSPIFAACSISEMLQNILYPQVLESEEVILSTLHLDVDYDIFVVEHAHNPEDVLHKAQSRLGEKHFNFFLNNDEHFAYFCKSGVPKSCRNRMYVLKVGKVTIKLYSLGRRIYLKGGVYPEVKTYFWRCVSHLKRSVQREMCKVQRMSDSSLAYDAAYRMMCSLLNTDSGTSDDMENQFSKEQEIRSFIESALSIGKQVKSVVSLVFPELTPQRVVQELGRAIRGQETAQVPGKMLMTGSGSFAEKSTGEVAVNFGASIQTIAKEGSKAITDRVVTNVSGNAAENATKTAAVAVGTKAVGQHAAKQGSKDITKEVLKKVSSKASEKATGKASSAVGQNLVTTAPEVLTKQVAKKVSKKAAEKAARKAAAAMGTKVSEGATKQALKGASRKAAEKVGGKTASALGAGAVGQNITKKASEAVTKQVLENASSKAAEKAARKAAAAMGTKVSEGATKQALKEASRKAAEKVGGKTASALGAGAVGQNITKKTSEAVTKQVLEKASSKAAEKAARKAAAAMGTKVSEGATKQALKGASRKAAEKVGGKTASALGAGAVGQNITKKTSEAITKQVLEKASSKAAEKAARKAAAAMGTKVSEGATKQALKGASRKAAEKVGGKSASALGAGTKTAVKGFANKGSETLVKRGVGKASGNVVKNVGRIGKKAVPRMTKEATAKAAATSAGQSSATGVFEVVGNAARGQAGAIGIQTLFAVGSAAYSIFSAKREKDAGTLSSGEYNTVVTKKIAGATTDITLGTSGTIVGALVAGPIGAVVGGFIGSMAGSALGELAGEKISQSRLSPKWVKEEEEKSKEETKGTSKEDAAGNPREEEAVEACSNEISLEKTNDESRPHIQSNDQLVVESNSTPCELFKTTEDKEAKTKVLLENKLDSSDGMLEKPVVFNEGTTPYEGLGGDKIYDQSSLTVGKGVQRHDTKCTQDFYKQIHDANASRRHRMTREDSSGINCKNLIFTGIKESSEDICELVIRISREIGAQVTRQDVKFSKRLGRIRADQEWPRKVLVSLHTEQKRDEILNKRRNLHNTSLFYNVRIYADEAKETRIEKSRMRSAAYAGRQYTQGAGEKAHGNDFTEGNSSLQNVEKLPKTHYPEPHGGQNQQPRVYRLNKWVRNTPRGKAFFSAAVFLSNFHPSPITMNGHTFPTAEHAFQHERALEASDLFAADAIKAVHMPKEARDIGNRVRQGTNWNILKLRRMKIILELKFRQNPHLRRQLLETGNEPLIEASTDRFWGAGVMLRSSQLADGDWYGDNNLGRLLMRVRDDLRA